MWDAFISHASEDKQGLVRPLAEAMASYGLDIWYDEMSLSVGDSLSRSIDKGLANSKFGVVVLSPAFISKNWPEYELRGLTAREIEGGKVILPLWHNITRQEVLAFSPPLADKLAIATLNRSTQEIALDLIKVIRPDVFSQVHRKLRWEEQLRSAKTITVNWDEIKPSPIIHEELSDALIGRVRLVRAALWGTHTHSMKVWVDGFRRDLHPDKEIEWWEHVAACYLEFIKSRKLTLKQVEAAFATIFFTCNGEQPEDLVKYKTFFRPKDFELLLKLPQYRYPILDVKEEFPERSAKLPAEAYRKIRAIQIDDLPSGPEES